MNLTNRLLATGVSVSLLILVFELVRRKKLKEKYAILWLLSGTTILILAIFDNLLKAITIALGITLPINTVFFFGIFFIILINIHFSLVISNLSEQNRKMAQKISLLEARINYPGKK